MARQPKKKYAKNRHAFYIKVVTNVVTGRTVTSRVWADVIHATEPVKIELNPAHVRRSIKLKGVGDTSKCSVAICTVTHEKSFPHNVEGHVDWDYSRCWVVSKADNMGLPVECYAYDHDHHEIAKLNDSLGGQKKLLKMLIKDGPMTITLSPIRVRSKANRDGGTPRRTPTGARSANKLKGLRGAKLRYTVAQHGGYKEMMEEMKKNGGDTTQATPKRGRGRPSQDQSGRDLISEALREAARLRKQ